MATTELKIEREKGSKTLTLGQLDRFVQALRQLGAGDDVPVAGDVRPIDRLTYVKAKVDVPDDAAALVRALGTLGG